MRVIKIRLKIKNPRSPRKTYESNFMVDSGGTFTVVPGKELKKLGIKPIRNEWFSLVDGKVIERKVGNALFEFRGVEAAAPVMFGEKGDSELLGIFTLEALGLSLDTLKRELYQATLRM